jgi:hypothetical protein
MSMPFTKKKMRYIKIKINDENKEFNVIPGR